MYTAFLSTIYNQEVRCPSLMFKLPMEVKFETGNYTYTPIIRKIKLTQTEPPFVENVNLAHFDSVTVAASDIKMFDWVQQLQLDLEREMAEQSLSITIVKHGALWWLSVATFGILGSTSVGLVIYNLSLTKRANFNQKRVANNIKESTSVYERTSCLNCSKHKTTQIVQSPSSKEKSKVEIGKDESVNINIHTRPLC